MSSWVSTPIPIPMPLSRSEPAEEVLLQQGSWKDPETVRRFYSGITDRTLSQAMAIHG